MIPKKNLSCSKNRKAREKEARRQAILESARTIIQAEGYHNATVAQIAADAEFGIGTIYQFFANKHKLFEEVLFWELSEFTAGLHKSVSHDASWQEQLSAFVRYYLYWTEHEPHLQQMIQDVILSALPDEATAMIERLKDVYRDILHTLETILHDILKTKDTETSELIIHSIIGTVTTLSDSWTMNMLSKKPTAYGDKIITSLINILGGLLVEEN